MLDTPPALTETALETEALQAFTAPFGVLGPSIMFALPMRRHMERWGTTTEHLGQSRCPCGPMRPQPQGPDGVRPLTPGRPPGVTTGGRPLSPLRLLPGDRRGLRRGRHVSRAGGRPSQPPGRRAGFGPGHRRGPPGPAMLNAGSTADGYDTGGGRSVARQLYARAGLGPADVDVAQLYDNFSGQVLFGLEDFGFCERGASGPLRGLRGARPGRGRAHQHGRGQPVRGLHAGLNHVIEGVHQMRGHVHQPATASARRICSLGFRRSGALPASRSSPRKRRTPSSRRG